MSIGENIKKLRKREGLTQREFGEKVGLSEITIRRYEKEINTPTIEIINTIANKFNISVEDILDFTKEQEEMLDKIIEESANHAINDVLPLVEYINIKTFSGKYNIKSLFNGSTLVDLTGLIDDIIANRIRSAANINSNDKK